MQKITAAALTNRGGRDKITKKDGGMAPAPCRIRQRPGDRFRIQSYSIRADGAAHDVAAAGRSVTGTELWKRFTSDGAIVFSALTVRKRAATDEILLAALFVFLQAGSVCAGGNRTEE